MSRGERVGTEVEGRKGKEREIREMEEVEESGEELVTAVLLSIFVLQLISLTGWKGKS